MYDDDDDDEGLFSTIQQTHKYLKNKTKQQTNVEGYQKGTRPIKAGYPLQKTYNDKQNKVQK